MSTHTPTKALEWLMKNHNNTSLEFLRSMGIDGPFPSMLSDSEEALILFIEDDSRFSTCLEDLTKLSGFPIIIRPVQDAAGLGLDLRQM